MQPSFRHSARGLSFAATLVFLSVFVFSDQALGQDDTSRAEMSRTVAHINGEAVSFGLISSLTRRLPPRYLDQPVEVIYEQVLDDIIDVKLAAGAAREAGLGEDEQIRELAQRAYDQVLAETWLNAELRRRLDADGLRERYNALLADEEGREEIKARHILVVTEDEAKAAIARLEEGEDFAALARELSTGPSGPNGGDLGYFRRGDMVAAFADTSFALEVGQFSQTPVETSYGWHVILVEDKRQGAAPDYGSFENAVYTETAHEITSELYEAADISRKTLEELMASPLPQEQEEE